MTFAERLKSVPWETMYHSYGSAANVPDLIMGLRSPKKRERDHCRDYLLYSLDHQGVQRWDSTARAVPFLLELLRDPQTPDRHLLIPLLADFAVGSADGVYLYTGFHIDQSVTPEGTKEYGYFVFRENKGSPEDLAYGQMVREIYEEVAKGLPLYLELIRTQNSRMRVFAPYVLAWLTDRANLIAPSLLEQFLREKNLLARASQAMALSYLTTFDPKLRDICLPAFKTAFTRARGHWERRALAIALLRGGVYMPEVRTALLEALTRPAEKPIPYWRFPWAYSDNNNILLGLLFDYAPVDWKESIVLAICEGLPGVQNEHTVLDLVTILMSKVFEMPPEDQRPQWYDAYRTVEWENLNDLQKHVLKVLVKTPLVWHFGNASLLFNGYGLPPYQDRMEKFVAGEGDVMRFRYKEEHLLPPDFFARLNAVNWLEQRHVYGTATDLPDMLRALLSPDEVKRTEALEKISKSLVYGYPGQPRQEVSLIVIPFLRQMLVNPAVPDRHRLLALLADLAVDGAQSPRAQGYATEYYYFVHGFDIERNYTPEKSLERGHPVFYNTQGSAEDQAYGQMARRIYQTVREGLDDYLTFVNHPEMPFRVFAPFLLAWLNADITPCVMEQFMKEASPLARSSQALAFAYSNVTQPDQWISHVQDALKISTDALERRMFSIALLRAGHFTDEARDILCRELEQVENPYPSLDQFPWARLEDNNFLLDFLLTHAPWRKEVIQAVLRYIATCTDEDQAEDAAETLLGHTFRSLETEERFGIADTGSAPPLKLSEEQRLVLQMIVDADIFWEEDGYPHLPLLGYGVPGYRDQVKTVLGT